MTMIPSRANGRSTRFVAPALGAIGVGALLVTVGCGTGQGSVSQPALAASTAVNEPGSPIVVSCEPTQRTLVRPVVVNGSTVSQVECITNTSAPVAALPVAAPAVEYRQVRATPVSYDRADDLPDARVVPVAQPVARTVPARQVVYEDVRPVRKTRSVKKSAIIIGSSAGAGAGIGAAVGGKKGALIGAAIGGGGAALWDQITRRDR
jgi:hypothetical protein